MGILDYLPGSVEMAACMRCGRTDLANPAISEDRPHDVQFHGYTFFELSEEASTWASAWPRFAVVNNRGVYLPASARFDSVAELQTAIAAAAVDQAGATLRTRLLALGIPSDAPPTSLPEPLTVFVEMWEGLKLNDETPVEELLDAATRFSGPHRLATEVLSQRTDLYELAVRLFQAPELKRRSYGRFLVKQFDLTGPDLLAVIGVRLMVLNDNQTGELYETYNMLREMDSPPLSLLPEIEGVAARVEKKDYYAHKDLMAIVKKWKALSEL
jgi:hypothetical protein